MLATVPAPQSPIPVDDKGHYHPEFSMHDAEDNMCFEAIESTHESTMAALQSFIENDTHEAGLEYGHNEEDIAADNMARGPP